MSLSPAEVGELREAWQDRERRLDRRFGVLAVLIGSPNRDTDAHPEPFTPATFFPSLAEPDEKNEVDGAAADAAVMAELAAAFGSIPWRGTPPPGWRGEVVET